MVPIAARIDSINKHMIDIIMEQLDWIILREVCTTHQHTQCSNQSHDLILRKLQRLLQEIQRFS